MPNFKAILDKLTYEIELVTQLLVVFAAGIIYGIMEALYIQTEILELSVFGHWSWYHVGLTALMIVTSFSLALSHIQSLLLHKKKYVLLMCLGSVPLSLMIEDATWFITLSEPIEKNEWTMLMPGLGVNLGFTWIPLWYIIVTIFSVAMFWIAERYAKRKQKENA